MGMDSSELGYGYTDPGAGDVLARRLIDLANTWIQRWLPPVIQKDVGVVIQATQGSDTDHVATVDLGPMQVQAEWTPFRFSANQLRGKRVRVLWDSISPMRVLDDIIA